MPGLAVFCKSSASSCRSFVFLFLVDQVDGTSSERITIRGSGGTDNRGNIVLHGAGVRTRVLEIKHDYYTIEARISMTPNTQ